MGDCTILDDVTEAIFQGIERGDDTRTIAYYALKAAEKAVTHETFEKIENETGVGRRTIRAVMRAVFNNMEVPEAAPKLSLESEML